MSDKFKGIIICLFAGLLVLPFINGCKRKQEKAITRKMPVEAVKVKRDTIKEFLFYVGDIKAEDEAIVYPKVNGKVIKKLAKEGDPVKKGDVLAYVDRDEVGFQFQQAPVESPLEGIVGKVYVDIGTSVSPQVPIGLVVNMDVVKVKINVVERDLPKVKEGQAVGVKVDAYPDEGFEGRIEKVSPVVDLSSRTASVEVRIPNSDGKLKPGMFARIKISIKEKENVLVIPRDAIIKEGSSDYVFVVKPDNKVHRQKIELGLNENNNFEVLNGLDENGSVVTMGNMRLKDGDTVEVIGK